MRDWTSGSCDLELARLSYVHYAGMEFGSPSWILLDLGGDSCGPQLAFVDTMIHSYDDDGASRVFLRAFLFTFTQLGATVEANRIIVSTRMFQSVMDKASHLLEPHHAHASFHISPFMPNVPVRGLWIWKMARFDEWAAAPVFRHLHLAAKDERSIKFIFR